MTQSKVQFPDHAAERQRMLDCLGRHQLAFILQRGQIDHARSICARAVELRRLEAARLPLSLPLSFGLDAESRPFYPPAPRAANPPIKASARKKPMTDLDTRANVAARLASAERKLAAVRAKRPAANSGSLPEADREALDRAFGLAQAREPFSAAAIARKRKPAPQAPRAVATRAADGGMSAADKAAMDRAFAFATGRTAPNVRLDGASLSFSVATKR